MSCIACGKKDTSYMLNTSYGLCADCLASVTKTTQEQTLALALREYNTSVDRKERYRLYTAIACFCLGLLGATIIFMLGLTQ